MKPTLLIVDDNEPLLRLLQSIFNKDYTVFTAADGVDAISLLGRGIRPELIICDLQMQNIDGYELVAHLFTSRLYQNIPVILLSEGIPGEDLPTSANVARVISKPFDPLFLKEAVTAVYNTIDTYSATAYSNTFKS